MHSYLGDCRYSFISAACVHLAGTLMMAVPFQKNQSPCVDAIFKDVLANRFTAVYLMIHYNFLLCSLNMHM